MIKGVTMYNVCAHNHTSTCAISHETIEEEDLVGESAEMQLIMSRRESSKRNYYILSPGVIIKAIIIIRCF